MKLTKSTLICLLLAAVLLFALAGCQKDEGTPTTEPTSTTTPFEKMTLIVTAEDIFQLEAYPSLKEVDLTGSTCYAAIEEYIKAHPEVAVTYTVALGGTDVAPDITELTLEEGSYDYDTLLENLAYLPAVKTIQLPRTALTAEQLAALSGATGAKVIHTVELMGEELDSDTTSLDLSGMTAAEIEGILPSLSMLTQLTDVELMNADGTSALEVTDVKTLMDALPGVSFNYSFEFFGKTLSTKDEKVEYTLVNMGDGAEAQIRQALDILPNCTYFKLDGCGISNEVMAKIRDDYPSANVVWRVYIENHSTLTDQEVIRATFIMDNKNSQVLKYCTKVKYLDLGHNDNLGDISFTAYMPDLELIIISGDTLITDLSPLVNCKKLYFFESNFCDGVKDLSPLAELPNLRAINVSFSGVRDLSPLDGMKLDRFVCMQNGFNEEQQAEFIEKHPECEMIRFKGDQPYGYGWRYVDDGITFWPYYANMREIFCYDRKDFDFWTPEMPR